MEICIDSDESATAFADLALLLRASINADKPDQVISLMAYRLLDIENKTESGFKGGIHFLPKERYRTATIIIALLYIAISILLVATSNHLLLGILQYAKTAIAGTLTILMAKQYVEDRKKQRYDLSLYIR